MKYKAVLAVAIAAAFLAAPFALVSDGSDAYTMTNGEAGIGYSAKNISNENLKKLFGETYYEMFIADVMEKIVYDYDSSDYEIDSAKVKVSDFNASNYMGMKVDDPTVTSTMSEARSYTIEFVVKSKTAGLTVFENEEKNTDIYKALGTGYVSSVGDVFTVKAEFDSVSMMHRETTYAKNTLGFVVTESYSKTYRLSEISADVTYKCTVDTKEKTIDYSISAKNEISVVTTDKYDFNGVAIKDITDASKCFTNRSVDDLGEIRIDEVTFDGSTKGVNVTLGKEIYEAETTARAYRNVQIAEANIDAPKYVFVGDTAFSLFYVDEISDPELKTNDGMKKFLQENGEIAETYDDAESAASSEYKSVGGKKDNKLLYIGIAAGAVAIIAIAAIAIVMIRKR